MPSAPIVTWARIFPLLAAVTPRSRYLKKERRPATRGALVGVAYASLPGGFTAASCPIGALASFIMEASSEFVAPMLPDPREEMPRPWHHQRVAPHGHRGGDKAHQDRVSDAVL